MPIRMAKSVYRIWIGARIMPSLSSSVLMRPSLRMTSMIAKVRISRLVQNGMVIRNSQNRAALGGRVAMK